MGDERQETTDDNDHTNVMEIFIPYLTIRASGKIRSFSFSCTSVASGKSVTV